MNGAADARRHLDAGILRIKVAGLAGECEPIFHDLMWERYRVDMQRYAGCTIFREEGEYASGYNSVMRPAITRQFGDDVFERTWEEAHEIEERIGWENWTEYKRRHSLDLFTNDGTDHTANSVLHQNDDESN